MLKRLVLVPVLASLVLLSCSKNDSLVDSRPVIDTTAVRLLSLSTYLVDTDTLDVVPGEVKEPTDPVQIPLGVTVHTTADIAADRMRCRISFEATDQEIVETTLPRIAAMQYGAVVPVPITRGDVGDYRVEVFDPAGQSPVNTARTKFTIVFGNRAPVLSDLVAPDTLVRPPTGSIAQKITVRCTDPSGAQDIRNVFFSHLSKEPVSTSGLSGETAPLTTMTGS